MIKAIIFDLGGVVVVDNPKVPFPIISSRGKWEKALGGQISEGELFAEFARQSNLSVKQNQAIKERVWTNKIPDPEIIKLLEALHKNYKLAVISNTLPSILHYRMKKYNLEKYFSVRICSAEVGMLKPEPAIFRLALNKLSVQPKEAVFIDDNEDNVKGARLVGIHGILYKNPSQLEKKLQKLGNLN